MLCLVEFKKFFISGTSQCFLGLCNDKKEWVIRLKKTGKNSKRLFSQLVASQLAELIGISCPKSEIIEIHFDFIDPLPDKFIQFDNESDIGVGSNFISGLTHFPKPENYNNILQSPSFGQLNLNHLQNTISSKAQFDQLYGMKVFTDWINMSDYHKYENLCLQPDNSIIFLDFDLAFSGNNGSWSIPANYESNAMISHQAPFWEGLVENDDVYNPWMEKILNISKDNINSIFSQIPNCWGIPNEYIDSLKEFLLINRNQFIAEFFSAVEFRQTIDEIENM